MKNKSNQILKEVNIAVVDDHMLFRKGLGMLLSQGDVNKRYRIIIEANNGADFITKMKSPLKPDIVILDTDMPEMNGVETTIWLKKNYADIKILAISKYDSEKEIIDLFQLGINGYLSKNTDVSEFHAALNDIADNGFYLTGTVGNSLRMALIDKTNSVNNPPKQIDRLTYKEKAFIQLACSELTYKEMAFKMMLSPKTIEGYRVSVFQQLKVRSRVGLVLFAIKYGLIKIDRVYD